MYKKTLRRHSYWKERDPFHVESFFIGGARDSDIGDWLGVSGVI